MKNIDDCRNVAILGASDKKIATGMLLNKLGQIVDFAVINPDIRNFVWRWGSALAVLA